MMLNVEKCQVMHFKYNNKKVDCVMDGRQLEEVFEERDLGIIIQEDLKWNK